MDKSPKQIVRTKRLVLREATLDDAEFILQLVNEPGWQRYIKQHSIDSLPKAREYIQQRLLSAYEQHGYGLWLMQRTSDGAMLGMCGLVRRESLPEPDLGFAQLEQHCGQGYAQEAGEAVIQYATKHLLARTLLAITMPENERSIDLLLRLGFSYNADFIADESQERLLLYALELDNGH